MRVSPSTPAVISRPPRPGHPWVVWMVVVSCKETEFRWTAVVVAKWPKVVVMLCDG